MLLKRPLIRLVGTLIQRQQFQAAEIALRQICKRSPKEGIFQRLLLSFSTETGRWAFLAEQAKVLIIASEDPANLSLRPNTLLFNFLSKVISNLLENNKHAEVEHLLQFLEISQAPPYVIQFWKSSLVYYQGLDKQAEDIYLNLLKQEPENIDLSNLIHLQLAKYDWLSFKLDKTLEWTQEIRPGRSKEYLESVPLRYRALIRQNKLAQAKAELKQLIHYYPSRANGYALLAELLCFSQIKNYQEVIELCSRAAAQGAFNEDLACYQGIALLEIGESEKALRTTQEYLSKNPTSNLAQMTKAQVLRKKGGEISSLEPINEWLRRGDFSPVVSSGTEQEMTIEYLQCDPGYSVESDELVSVIMTAYQQDKWLKFAVDSVLQQTYRNLELIIVDDCSTDSTWKCLQELSVSDPRVRPFRLQKNSGTYIARNHALNQAKGKYIAFLDSDDWMHPQSLERRIDILKNSDVVCVTTNAFRVTEESNIEFKPHKPTRLSPTTPCFKRDPVFTSMGYFDSVRTTGDLEYLQRVQAIFSSQQIKHLDFPLLVASRHGASLTGGGEFALAWYGINESRSGYIAAFRKWHRHLHANPSEAYIPYPLDHRRFPAPITVLA